ncbi:MAG: tetratricopeptide repeat protein [Nitrospirae bacterium]|nr:tetratricopeptide repeat protein [Nitrospirota bacterium]
MKYLSISAIFSLKRIKSILVTFFLIVLSFLNSTCLYAAQNHDVVGKALLVRGAVNIKVSTKTAEQMLVKEQNVYEGSIISTAANSRAILLFSDDAQLKINENTTITITREMDRNNANVSFINLHKGEIWNKAEKVSAPKIKTPVATAAISGTSWITKVYDNGNTFVSVLTGHVELFNEYGVVVAKENEVAFAEKGKMPIILQVVPSKDSLQWIYFPQETLRYLYLQSDNVEILNKRLAMLDIQESTPDQDMERAEIYHDLGQIEKSLGILKKLTSTTPSPRALADMAIILMKKGDWGNSEQIISALSEGPVQLYVAKVILSIHQNKFDEAAEIIENAKKGYGDSVLLSATYAYLLLLRGDIKDTMLFCEENMKKYPDTAILSTLLNSAYLVLDDLNKSNRLTDEMLSVNKMSALSHFDRAIYMDRVLGSEKSAIEEYKMALELSHENPYVAKNLGNLLVQMGRYKEALSIFERFTHLGYENADLLYSYGLLLSQVDRDSDAQSEYSHAKVHEGSVSALFGEGISMLKLGKPQEALEQLTSATVLEPKYALNYVYLAIAYYQLGRVSEALNTLNRAKEADQNDLTPYIVESIIYNDLYEPYKSIETSKKAESLLQYRKRGELDFIKATKNGISNIGYSYQELGLDYWAFKKSQDILALDPYDPNAHLLPALVYTNLVNPAAGQSEYVQGLIMDSSAIIEPNRDRPIIKIPSNYTTSIMSMGTEGFGMSNIERLKTSGYIGEPYKIDYFLQATRGENLNLNRYNSGTFDIKETGDFDTNGIKAIIGWHPAYDTNIYTRFEGNRIDSSTSAYSSMFSLPYSYYSPDNSKKNSFAHFEGGYHYRIAQDSHLLIRPYLIDANIDTISVGTVNPVSLYTTWPSFPASYIGAFHIHETGLQAKHMLNIDSHNLSYGLEQFSRKLHISTDAKLYISQFLPVQTISEANTIEQNAWKVYLRDRWKILPSLSVDIGTSVQSNWISQLHETNSFTLCPRLGIDFKPTNKDTLRGAYQRNIIPLTFPYRGIRIGYYDTNDIISGPGQLESNDVSGLLPFEQASIGLQSDMYDTRFRWEREWTDSLLHFNEIGYQKITGVGELKMLWTGINWIAHPRIGIQLAHFHVFDVKYETAPFELDRVAKDYYQLKLTYVHPTHIKAIIWQEYFTPKHSYFSTLGDTEPYYRTNMFLSWESPKKNYSISTFWFNIWGGRQNLKGLNQNDRFAFIQLEYRL